MNKLIKIFYAIIGAMNLIFQIYIPLVISLISVTYFNLKPFASMTLLIVGIGASLYQATKNFIK